MKNSDKEKRAMAMFDNLRKHLNEKVRVLYTHYGVPRIEEDELTEVDDYHCVAVGCSVIPFVGYGCAIHSIIASNDEILYFNRHMDVRYDLRDNKDIDEARKAIFGGRIVAEEIAKREEYERKTQEFLEKAAQAAKRDKASLQEAGLALIKPETKDDWIEFTENNCNDGYSCCVVRATVDMLKAMENPDCSFKEAENEIFNEKHGLTGFQAGAVASCLSHFAKRGDEFRKYWNSQWGVSEEEKGTVNPAVLTIGK